MGRIGKIIDAVLFLAVLGGLAYGGYRYRHDLDALWRRGAADLLPCRVPIRYSLDRFDSRFGIDRDDFLAIVGEASQAWSEAVGRPLFAYHPEGELKINLIYDYRQEATDRLRKMGLSIETGRESYDRLKAEYEAMKVAVGTEQEAYESAVGDLNQRIAEYEREVESWNRRGGAPTPVHERLQAERQAIQVASEGLNARNSRLKKSIDELNAVITVLNRMASGLNLTATEFNQTATARGERFQEGEYVRDPDGTRINIYEFEDREMLKRVLTHEFGHAVGLEHVPDEQAIMYELNSSSGTSLSESDRQAIRERCGE
ncbi:matrixin family metalloprotease [Candidatus Uhrbacteria bacterium]|nr:matrixin family metalloprotease [Candidatus Uhrbacteria bacterium]